MVELPAQDVPGPAAQSFFPASDTPKHFSMAVDCALTWPADMVKAAAMEAANGKARVLVDMFHLSC
jgi:hypothetical protein